jgi:hypothetical protein
MVITISIADREGGRLPSRRPVATCWQEASFDSIGRNAKRVFLKSPVWENRSIYEDRSREREEKEP